MVRYVRNVDQADLPVDHREAISDYDPSMFARLHAAEETHFWHVARRRLIVAQMKRHVPRSASILEIGAGTGFVATALVGAGYDQYLVGDRYPEALRYAASHLPAVSTVQFDIRHPPFRQAFDAALLFDVIEHLDDDVESLRQVASSLRTGGRVVITVPAHQWLWHADDVVSGHKRRYSRKMLRERLALAGFDVDTSFYFFVGLLPLLLIRRLLDPDRGEARDQLSARFFAIGRLQNRILGTWCKVEQALSRVVPNVAGGSIFVVAVKRSACQ